MLLSAEQHARLAARLRQKAADPKLTPLERRRLLESAERFEWLSVRARLVELMKEVSGRNSVYSLVEEASKGPGRTKPRMQGLLAAWEAGARESGQDPAPYTKLRAILEKSKTVRDFLVAARRWRDSPGHGSKDR